MPNVGCCVWSIFVPVIESKTLRSGLAQQQRIELAGAIERGQIVETADVNLADIDLRHGAPAGFLYHLVAACRVEVDADFLDLGDAFRLEQHLGALTERTHGGAVHADRRHECASYFCTGRPACCQATKPPLRLTTLVKPCFRSAAAAVVERLPVAQYTITGLSLNFSISPRRASSCDSGSPRALRTCDCANSACSRTSSSSASWRLIICVASSVVTDAPPAPRRSSGNTSIAPLTTATATRKILSITNFTPAPNVFGRNRAGDFARPADRRHAAHSAPGRPLDYRPDRK